MKKTLTFLGILLCTLVVKLAVSQVAVNFKGGMNISSMMTSFNYDQIKAKAGVNIGITSEFMIIDPLGIETGLLFTTKGYNSVYTKVEKQIINNLWWQYDTTTYKSNRNYSYLELPLKVTGSFNLGNSNLVGSIGPYFGLALQGKISTDKTTEGNTISYTNFVKFGNDPENSYMRRFDCGLSLGLGLNKNRFHMGLSYDLGLKNIATASDKGSVLKNRAWIIDMGYRIEYREQNYKSRIRAVKRIKNQEKLSKIVLEDKDYRVRLVAVNKINDQNILYNVALDDNNYEVKLAALNRLTDPNLICMLAIKSNEPKFQMEAVNKVTDQNILYIIALKATGNEVTTEAFNRITDQNLIHKLALGSKESKLRLVAVSKITDQNILFNVAMNDVNYEVKVAAFNQITDQPLITRLALESKDSNMRKLAINKVTDQDIIYKIALEDKDYDIKVAAMSRLTQNLLVKLMTDFKESNLKIKVIDFLSDQTELLKISQNNSDWDVRKAAFRKLNDNSLDILTREAKDPALILSAKIRLGLISWKEAFSGNKSSTVPLNHIIGAAAIVDTPQPSSYDVVSACHNFIQLGDASRIPELIFLLNKFGDVSLAEDYMNCGESTLEDAGCKWGRERGYTCTTGNGSARVRWGSKK